jgi:hypothetical protein
MLRPIVRITAALTTAALTTVGLSVALGAAPAFAVAPNTVISAPEDGALVLPGPVTFTFASDQGGATFECSLDSVPFAACTSPISYADLGLGGHLFKVRAVLGGVPDPTPAQHVVTVRNVPCEQAGAAYQQAQSGFFVWQQKLVRAKKQLHRAHSHGSATAFQHAKNKVKRVKTRIATYKQAMNEALGQEQAVC